MRRSEAVAGQLPPPRAPKRPTVLHHADDERVDDWYWLRDRDDPAVLAYLEAENTYTQAMLAGLAPLRHQIFDEIKGRVHETDASAPVRKGEWEYFTRTLEGHQYALHCRRPADTLGLPDPFAAPGTPPGEEIVLDENALAADHGFFALRGFAVSPDQCLLAYASDVTGGERSTVWVRDLVSGVDLDDELVGAYYGLAWANDGSLLYVRPDAMMRPFEVWRHILGTGQANDGLVYREDDERFFIDLARARTGRVLVITSGSKITTEVRIVDADQPDRPAVVFAPREHGIEYHVAHHVSSERGHRFFVVTNADGAENFKLMVAMAGATDRRQWTEVLPHRDDVRLDAVHAFAEHLVCSERAAGLEQLRVLPLADGAEHTIPMAEEVFSAWVGANPEFETSTLRYGYTSLVTPPSDVRYDIEAGTSTVVKRQPVAGYDPEGFETARVWAVADDGTRIPISVVRRRDVSRDGSAPLVLYGYGSYEISIDPTFSISRLSLLERGVVYAIAHIRGGGELGRRWYEAGKLAHKKNTFTDFVACAEHLVEHGYSAADRLVIRGGSAGGLLMGAAANLRPELFRAVVAQVPFVDVLTTILDESLPLTITEWEEWGNPVIDPATYAYIKSYSPYDNVRAQPYPTILATGGLNDPRVQYWEPAKWAAKLRDTSTSGAPILLKTELGAGHHGPSGRYAAWEEEAFVLAFMLDQLGCA